MITEDFARVVAEAIASLGVGFVLIISIALLALIILMIVGRVKLFKKCGHPGWKAIVPFYTDYVFFTQICGLHWAWAAACIVTSVLSLESVTIRVLTLLVDAFGFYNLAIKCHKDKIATMIFGALFPHIIVMVYGLNKDITYYPYEEVKQSGLF